MNQIKESWSKTPKWVRIIGYTILGLIGAAALGIVFGFIVQWLWNALMPGIFSLRQITYWEAVGIVVLARLIFGSFGGGHDDGPGKHGKKPCKSGKNSGSGKTDESWKYYDEWWEKEGEQAFESYAEKTKETKTDKE